MSAIRFGAVALTLIGLSARPALAFCGFYVAKADAKIYNHSSQVVIARDADRTVLTISNDFSGPLTEFAEVVPVPAVLQKEQVHVGDRRLLERIDAYSSPRLVEYFDPNPCDMPYPAGAPLAAVPADDSADDAKEAASARSLGVKIEAEYTVGEYDIVILSANESSGLEIWLRSEGYRIPAKSAAALEPYVKQDMKFFVAKVNLKEQAKAGFTYLRPIQIAYESPKFMLPIQLGMANADGAQDLTIYTLTRNGRVESTNYHTVEVPSGMDVPVFVKDKFTDFYRAMFEKSYEKEAKRAVFTEYAWNSAGCDPCADQPLSHDDLVGLGVPWLSDGGTPGYPNYAPSPIVTRLHVRYDREHFPEDLVFQETGNQQNFQARYVLRHAWKGDATCDAGRQYRDTLRGRHREEAARLHELTGWELADIYSKMGDDRPDKTPEPQPVPWYMRLWKN